MENFTIRMSSNFYNRTKTEICNHKFVLFSSKYINVHVHILEVSLTIKNPANNQEVN